MPQFVVPPLQFGVTLPMWQPVAGPVQVPKVPPFSATTVSPPLYVTARVPGRLIDPFACVFTVAAAWHFVQFGVALCFGCDCVVRLAESVPWHSVQLFVPPPSTVFHVYGEIAAVLCPLLWHWLIPQVPNVPPAAATARPPPACT